jgi:hypothetical protein
VGVSTRVANLDDIPAAVGLNRAHDILQRRNITVVMQGWIFERRHAPLIDGYRRGYYAADASECKPRFEGLESGAYRSVIESHAPAERGSEDAVFEFYSID